MIITLLNAHPKLSLATLGSFLLSGPGVLSLRKVMQAAMSYKHSASMHLDCGARILIYYNPIVVVSIVFSITPI